MIVDPMRLESHILERLRSVSPATVSIGTASDVRAKIARVRQDVSFQALDQERWTPGIAVYDPDDEWGGLVCFLGDIPPFMHGRPADVDDDLEEFLKALCWKLDEPADAITEESSEAWPDRSFSEPHAQVSDGELRVWWGSLEQPRLKLSPIPVNALLPRSKSD